MFFGLCNSPSTFQAFMDHILADLIREGKVIVYIDDILVFTETLEEQHRVMTKVLEILWENHLCMKAEKCEFDKRELEFLGVIVGEGKMRMDPGKVQAVREWKTPTNVTKLCSFLGFVNFDCRFIRDFARSSLC